MADPIVNTAPLIWLGGYDLSSNLNSVALKAGRADLMNQQFGDTLACTFPGIQQVDAQIKGFWSAPLAGGEADQVHAARIITKDAAEWPLTLLPQDAPGAAGADGNIGYNLRSAQFAMEFGTEHGGLLPFSGKALARTGRLDRMTVMLPKAVYTITTTGTALELGALTASQKLVAVLHVFAATGTWTATVESDIAGFGTPTTQATFTAATGITRQVKEVAGPVTDSWWRVVFTETVAGTATAAVLLAVTAA